jgi:hypothetical protein
MEVFMSEAKKTHKFHWLGTAAVAALSIAAVAVPLTPAKAFVGVDIGGVGIGVGGPYVEQGYYYPPYYHHYYGYYRPYYGPYGW